MKLDIMGLQFDNVTMDEAAARAEQILAGDRTCYAVTPNAEIAYEALHDEKLRALINGADLVLPAGAGVVLASKRLKTPLNQKVAGVAACFCSAASPASQSLPRRKCSKSIRSCISAA